MKHYVRQGNALYFDVRAVLYGVLGTDLTQIRDLGGDVRAFTIQHFYLVADRRAGGVACKPLFARFEEFLRPAIILALRDPLEAADRSNIVLATQAFQHDADFTLS